MQLLFLLTCCSAVFAGGWRPVSKYVTLDLPLCQSISLSRLFNGRSQLQVAIAACTVTVTDFVRGGTQADGRTDCAGFSRIQNSCRVQ